jgi:hypothetical protein
MLRLEAIANAEFDGHFTVMKFTTNWRVCFGTPMEAYSEERGDKDKEMCEGRTFEEAAVAAIRERRNAICINWFDVEAMHEEMRIEEEKLAAMTEEEIIDEEIQLVDHYLAEEGLTADETSSLVARKETLALERRRVADDRKN